MLSAFCVKRLRGEIPKYLVALSAAALVATTLTASATNKGKKPLVTVEQGNFFVGGTLNAAGRRVGQMYVEYQIPENRNKIPIVLIHGGGQIGAGWNQTPDGRDGWRQFFLRQGYAVYVVDQPGRGRSPYDSDLGTVNNANASTRAHMLWARPEDFPGMWPAAYLHTRWIGPATDGDPTFDQFLMSQSDSVGNQENLTSAALIALLDKIGPAVLIPHSQPGPHTYRVADLRPNLVKAIVNIEPGPGPLTTRIPGFGAPGPVAAPIWGLTSGPMTYSPAVTDPAQLGLVPKAVTDDPYVTECYAQTEPAHKLINLAKVPMMLLTSEAGYNTLWDPCTYRYLVQAGVRPDWVRLEKIGIRGNSHFMFIENNSDQIAGLVQKWIEKRVKVGGGHDDDDDDHGHHH
jgi:pimeloyl-ACP methyl ester carboxylesterase